jgi:hypothetical protein
MHIKTSITTVSPKAVIIAIGLVIIKSNENIRLFWASEDFKNIYAQSFNFKSKNMGAATIAFNK